MNLFGKNLDRDIVLIAEIGVNHEGNVETAAKLIRSSAEAGADAVKFQSYTPKRFIAATDAERLTRIQRFMLDEAAHRTLAKIAKDAGIVFFSSAITEDWVDLIAELSPAIKIASGDLTFEPVIRAAARTGRLLIVSTGCGTVEEIDRTVDWIADEVGRENLAGRLVLMHCVAAYPTPLAQANLASIPFLGARYGVAVGWSNHVLGSDACHAAVALGARVVEVHVTDRKRDRTFRDHELSLEPPELAELAEKLPLIRASIGEYAKAPMPCEISVRDAIRKGVTAARDLPKGTVLCADDLMYSRPASGFPAEQMRNLIGRHIKSAVVGGTSLLPAHIDR